MPSPRVISEDLGAHRKKDAQESPQSVTEVDSVNPPEDFESFEKRREANIARNEAFLRSLGLVSIQQDLKASLDSDHLAGSGQGGSRRKRRAPSIDGRIPRIRRVASEVDGADLPRRSSRRLRKEGLGPEEVDGTAGILNDAEVTSSKGSSSRLRSRERVSDSGIQSEVDQLRAETYDIVSDLEDDDEMGSLKNRISASALLDYIRSSPNPEHEEFISNHMLNHTVMRINTMSIAALGLRLRKLKDREKILIFYYGLRLAGLHELAEVAKKIAITLKIADFAIE